MPRTTRARGAGTDRDTAALEAALHEARSLLEASQTRYADLYDRAPIAYVTTGGDGGVREINANAAALSGHQLHEALGQSFSSVVAFKDPVAFHAHVQDCVTRGERVTGEWTFTRKGDGRTFVVRAISSPRSDGGETVAVTALIDMTEQRTAESARVAALEREQAARVAVEHSNRLKDDFLSVASHELRTPLSAILGWAHVIDRTKDVPSTVRRGIDVILRNARAQTRMVEDVLDVARLGRGALRLDLRDTDLAVVARGAAESVLPVADELGITLTVEAADDLHVWADAHRLQQVLWNLLTNALKFTSAGGRVVLRVDRESDDARVSVTDSGAGIAPEDLVWIFDRFRQVSRGPSRTHGGLGLGLTIVRRLVVEHGGEVVASSGGIGTGSTFTVTLPVLTPARAAELQAARDGERSSFGLARALASVRILLVDDDPDALELSADVLERAGAVVACASSAGDAYEALRRSVPSCLVTDLGMPEEDGFSLLRRVRTSGAPFARVPALALTAYARPQDSQAAIDAGFDGHIAKPFQPEALVTMIGALLPPPERRQGASD